MNVSSHDVSWKYCRICELRLKIVLCFEAASEAMFEEECGHKLQFGGQEEDLWVEKILTFAQQQSDSAPPSRLLTVTASFVLSVR